MISLYQEPTGWLGRYTRVPEDDPRWFGEQYGIIDPDDGKPITASDISDALVIYDGRVTRYDAEAAAR